MVWSSSSTIFVQRNSSVVVQLLDSGNLVVWKRNSTNNVLIWQSFDYPGDTHLAGMKFGKDLVTGLERFLKRCFQTVAHRSQHEAMLSNCYSYGFGCANLRSIWLNLRWMSGGC
ncbi:putative bulb-type lectin domain-containing protein [Helianthus anomalus]